MVVQSCWMQTAIFVMYFVAVFFTSRLLDAYKWFINDENEVINPEGLSIQELKQLLDHRGLNYAGCLEKSELLHLLRESGESNIDDLKDSDVKENGGNNRKIDITRDFSEETEDLSDTIWLVHLMHPAAGHNGTLLNFDQWNKLTAYFAPFSLRFGVHDCAVSPKFCQRREISRPALLLFIPQGRNEKPLWKVLYSSDVQHLIAWIHGQLESLVYNINSVEELENQWLSSNSPASDGQSVRVVLLTHLLHPPLFLAALTVKFTGKVKFGIFTVNKEDEEKVEKNTTLKNANFTRYPAYVISTPVGSVIYGRKKWQRANFESMKLYLKVLQPKMNDIFVISVLLLNMIWCSHLIQDTIFVLTREQTRWKIARYIGYMFWCNFWSMFAWVFTVSIINSPCVAAFFSYLLHGVQYFALTNIGSLFISDCAFLWKYHNLWALTYFCASFLALLLFSVCSPDTVRYYTRVNNQSNLWGQMRALLMDSLFTPMLYNSDTEFERLLSEFPLRDIWNRSWYIGDLPVWIYKEEEINVGARAIADLMDDPNGDPEDIFMLLNNLRCVNGCCRLLDSNVAQCCERCSESRRKAAQKDIIVTSDCAICLDDYVPGVYLCNLPCGHAFHMACVHRWLRANDLCPMCRRPAYLKLS